MEEIQHKKLLECTPPITVQALAIDFQLIYYQCPFELNTIHVHGNDTKSLLNRKERRCSHCAKGPSNGMDIELVVSNFTRRCGMKQCSQQKAKGKWKWQKGSEKILKRRYQKQVDAVWCAH